MSQLDGGRCTFGLKEADDAREGVTVRVRPDAEVAVCDSADPLDRSRLGKHETGPARRIAA